MTAAAVVAALSAAFPLFGFTRGDAVALGTMLGFPVYLLLLLWGFAERSLLRLGVILVLLAGYCFGIVFLIQRAGD